MWLMDHVFKYTNFGLVSLIHGDFFIRQVRIVFVASPPAQRQQAQLITQVCLPPGCPVF